MFRLVVLPCFDLGLTAPMYLTQSLAIENGSVLAAQVSDGEAGGRLAVPDAGVTLTN